MKRRGSEKKPVVQFKRERIERDERYYIRRETIEYKELVYTKINRNIFYCKLTTCKEERAGILGVIGRSRAIRHFSRVHDLQVDIPDQRLVKKYSIVDDHGDINSAKCALRSYNPTISPHSKLARVFIAGDMQCRKESKDKGPAVDVDLVTSPPSQVLVDVLGMEDNVVQGVKLTSDNNNGAHVIMDDMEAIKDQNQDKPKQALGVSKSRRRHHKATVPNDFHPRRCARLNP